MKNFNRYVKKAFQKEPELKEEMEFELWLSEVGLNISRLRQDKGYTQKTFAEKLGMSQSAVARIESGQNMQCSTIWLISDALEIDLEIFGVDKETEKQEFAYFYNYKTGGVVGATSEKKDMEYQATQAPSLSSLSSNFFQSYATIGN
ncbi:hypothetical protein COY07_00565 [Candidatus Peregrinibacteria bacterium CG_4_10_14_0_2_um_filter_43_11]|nr:MAG: hypothetical protein COY07_00565 [Candidatus Peregrinibacteria bacterium CG_4_10_14_0_2_um_filter_43_11]